VAERRRERGFGVPAWATHNRFIISYQTLRRPEYFEPLIQHLGSRLKKSLIVLDEAHTAAPASASKYAIDSRVTGIVRDLAPRFENRLFLSATPHNGHSNSFSALMEILDPQRFTRGVPIDADSGALDAVMVRRLKRDLSEARLGVFPIRRVVRVSLAHAGGDAGRWTARDESAGAAGQARPLGESSAVELRLSELLARYTELMKPKKGRGQLVFINLQKRLLSSVEAFYRTLQAHAERVESGLAEKEAELDLAADEPEDTVDPDEDQHDRDEDARVGAASAALGRPTAKAQGLLDEMLALAQKHRAQPDAKVLALCDWIREHQCPAVRADGARGSGKELEWSSRRVLIFTEYADTKRYLTRMLERALEGTRLGEERVMGFHGAMNEEQRDQVQRHFNGAPAEYPVRILVATDAAREGLNLQNHCADLFHYDIPWNPARMEQRNGRIDRTLQPEAEVRCHYFHYEARAEDAVLRKLVEKVDTIQDELGSLGDVVMQRMERVLQGGIDDRTARALDGADPDTAAREATERDLEAQRRDIGKLRAETDEAAKILNQSRQLIEFKPELLRDVVDVGLELAGAKALEPIRVEDAAMKGQEVFRLPELPESWTETLDTLRPPRERGEDFVEWRKQPPQPVVFRPLDRIGEERVHLHLEHPFVQRILSRFLSQGYSAQDLSRVTVVPNPDDALVRVVAFGRVSLFGRGAARLHDELVSVAAQWLESKGKGHLKPFADEADRRALSTLARLLHEAPRLGEVPAGIQERLRESAAEDFKALWKDVRDEADTRAHAAAQKLTARGSAEAEALKGILQRQRKNIERELQARQLDLFAATDPDAKKQWEGEKEHMHKRLGQIDEDLRTEPADIEALYQVSLKRLEPVGLVYLGPTTRM
jgi:superfamily II DNA/RNA helicase